jgi:hypothetical protein
VTYGVDPREDSNAGSAVGDHAYWVSGLSVRDTKAAPTGTIDARSAGFGFGDAPMLDVASTQGSLEGGSHGPMAYQRRERRWGPEPKLTKTNKLFVKATNIGAATLDGSRARVGCAPKLYLTTDGPLDLGMSCLEAKRSKPPHCNSRVGLTLPRVAGRPNVEATATRDGRTLATAKGSRVLRLGFRRPTRKAFSVQIVARAGGDGPALTLTQTRRVPRCSSR